MVLKTAVQGDFQKIVVVDQEPKRATLHPEPMNVGAGSFPRERLEDPVKARGRNAGLLTELSQAEVSVQVRLDMHENIEESFGNPAHRAIAALPGVP